jgi:hypothetical protein
MQNSNMTATNYIYLSLWWLSLINDWKCHMEIGHKHIYYLCMKHMLYVIII